MRALYRFKSSYLKRTKSQRIDIATMIFPAFFGFLVSAAVLISDLSQVPPSGDKYPANLPIATPKVKSLYSGKRLLFVASHGVEDHEIIYQHQFFTEREAVVEIACPLGKQIVISDFTKPSYLVD